MLRQAIFDVLEPGEELVEAPFARLIEAGKLHATRLRGVLGAIGYAPGAGASRIPERWWPRPVGALGRQGRLIGGGGRRRVDGCGPDAVMRSMSEVLGLPASRGPRILVASAHADDAEIGAGGTIRRLVDERPDASITWLVLAAPVAERAAEARASAQRLLEGVAEQRVDVRELRDGFLPFLGAAPKEAIAAHAARGSRPDPRARVATTPTRTTGSSASVIGQVFRRATVLEYEVPKWDGDLGTTNLYVPLTSAQASAKVAHSRGFIPVPGGPGLVLP